MFTKATAIKQAKQFLIDCRKIPIKINKAVLFGSVIKGTSNEYSDVDIAIFSEDFTDNVLLNIDIIGRVNIHYPNLDVHTFPASAYKKNEMLIDEIKHYGLEIK